MTEENDLPNQGTYCKNKTKEEPCLNKMKYYQLICNTLHSQKQLKIDTFPCPDNESDKKLKNNSRLKSMDTKEIKSILNSINNIKISKNSKDNNQIKNTNNIIIDKKVKLTRHDSCIIYNKKILKISNFLNNSQKLIFTPLKILKHKNERNKVSIYSSNKILDISKKNKNQFLVECYTFGKNTEESNNSSKKKIIIETINKIFKKYLIDYKYLFFSKIKNINKEILYEVDENDYELLLELESIGVSNIKEFNLLVKEMILWIKNKQN